MTDDKQLVEVTVVIAFSGVPRDVDLEELTVDGIPVRTLRLLDGAGLIRSAECVGYETTDAIGDRDFVVQLKR
jgi:hypothetical protein